MTFEAFARRRKLPIAAYLFCMACCNVSLLLREGVPLRAGYQDFTIYYTSGLFLREGRARTLYDLANQYQTQLTFAHVPIRHGALPYNHPPFEAILFVPFTFLGFWPAYLVWSAVSLILLAGSVLLLRRFPAIRSMHPGMIAITAFAFFPFINGLLQGQDSVLLMFLAVVALTCMDRGADVAAGAWLACGLFRPHMVIPLVLLLAVRRWRMLIGFSGVAVILAGISAVIMGWGWPVTYVRFVLLVEQARIGNFGPQVVPNIRGLIGTLLGPALGPVAGVLVLALSITILAIAAQRIRRGGDSLSYCFGLASVTTILVSFHAHSYELTLLIPFLLFLVADLVNSPPDQVRPERILLFLLLFLTPIYVYLLYRVGEFFWFGLIVCWLFFRLLRLPAPAADPG
ncbi:MAG: glycosyltransferase family 87 protein [Terriglobales bacterium]|jgi:hypothetical protein